jgi:MFS family permease
MEEPRPVPVRRLWLAVLCGYLALGATLQELPAYVVTEFGQGPAVAGLTVGLAFAATALVRPFAGRAGDAGLARPVVMAGGVMTALAALGHLLAPDIGLLLAARLLMGAGEAALFSGGLPWVLSGTPAGRRGRVAGWFGLSMWGGLATGPLVAVAAAHLGGSGAVWWTVVALPLVSTGLVATTSRPPHGWAAAPIGPASWRDVVPAGVGLPGFCLGLSAYGYGTLTALLVLYLTGGRIGGQSLGLAVFAAAFLVSRSAGSPLVDRYGGAVVARTVLVIEAAGLVLLAVAGTEPAALAGTAVTGIGIGVVYPSTVAVTLHRTKTGAPGAAVGTMTSFWDLGILAAGPLGGVIATCWGYRSAFATAAVLATAALAITFALRPAGSGRAVSRATPEPVRRGSR